MAEQGITLRLTQTERAVLMLALGAACAVDLGPSLRDSVFELARTIVAQLAGARDEGPSTAP